jgi:putative salt-induced outer membrane protein YdiY
LTLANNVAATVPIGQAAAWRLSNQFSLTTSLTDMFAVRVSQTTNYLNQPVPGFGRGDTIVSAALVTKFQKR